MTRAVRRSRPLDDEGLTRAALVWAERLEAFPRDPVLRADLDAWLERDPLHRDAFERTRRALGAADAAAGSARLDAMREQALAYGSARKPSWMLRAAAAVLAPAAALALIGGLWSWRSDPDAPPAAGSVADMSEPGAAVPVAGMRVHETDVGERTVVTLEDGSVLTLDTDSLVVVDYSEDARRISLERGQAHFDVARDVDRPFRVRADDRLVTALGTAFDVRLDEATVSVLLEHGRVAVTDLDDVFDLSEPPGPQRPELSPGQRMTVERRSDKPPVIEAADVPQATSWREGRLIFENDRLADAVREINRYTMNPIILVGAETEEFRVSGVFRTGRTDSFVAAVTHALPIAAETDTRGRIMLHPET